MNHSNRTIHLPFWPSSLPLCAASWALFWNHRPQQISGQEQRQDHEPYCRNRQHRPHAYWSGNGDGPLKVLASLVNSRLAEKVMSAGLFHGMKLFLLYLALLAAACAVLLLAGDPSRSGWLPECLFYKTTGFLCYGCGSTRALHALLHGHWLDSLRTTCCWCPRSSGWERCSSSRTGPYSQRCWLREQPCLFCLPWYAIFLWGERLFFSLFFISSVHARMMENAS